MGALMRQAALLATAAVAALAVAGSAPAAPERDALIRMGRAIGKIELGMTVPQVRRAFGGPHVSIDRRVNLGARGRYVELAWERPGRTSWEPVIWRVGFRSTTRRAPLRVVRVVTTTARERTPQRIGVGSTVAQIVRAYPHATCVVRDQSAPQPYNWIVVAARTGMTAFNLDSVLERGEDPNAPKRVVAVMVQLSWFSQGRRQQMPCPPGWERW